MKKILFTLTACLVLSLGGFRAVQAQSWGVGVRFGSPTAFNIKHYFGNNAWELNLGTAPYGFYDNPYGRYRGAGFSAMFNYLWRQDIRSARGLEFYYGLGALVSSRGYYYEDNGPGRRDDRYRPAFGIGPTGAIGMEYFIPNSPISLFLEANPYVEILPHPLYITLGGGIGGRFTF